MMAPNRNLGTASEMSAAVETTQQGNPKSNSGTSLRTLGSTTPGVTYDAASAINLSSDISSLLGDTLKGLGSQNAGVKGIMDTYAERRANAEKQGSARRSLIENKYAGQIEGEADKLGQSLNLESEARRGFATNTALVKQLTDTGAKRIRELARDRDSLLLEQNYLEAGRMDELIGQEQTAITEARKSWLDSFIQLTSAISTEEKNKRDALAFEMPNEKRERDFQFAEQTAINTGLRQLQTLAPDAGITAEDDYSSAVAKYRLSDTYKRDVRKAEQEIQAIQANIAQSYASAAAARASAAASYASADKSRAETRALTTPAAAADDSPTAPKNVIASLKDLKNDPAKRTALSPIIGPALRGTSNTREAAFNDKLNTVQSLLTLPNLGLLKGAMSDADRAFIISAGTSLAATNDPATFDKTLDGIILRYENALARQSGLEPATAPSTSAPSGGSTPVVPQGNLFSSFFNR